MLTFCGLSPVELLQPGVEEGGFGIGTNGRKIDDPLLGVVRLGGLGRVEDVFAIDLLESLSTSSLGL